MKLTHQQPQATIAHRCAYHPKSEWRETRAMPLDVARRLVDEAKRHAETMGGEGAV